MKKYILLVFVVIIALAGYFLLARGQHKLAANAAVSVTDSTGAKVHIPAEPKRIVFLNASNLEIFTSIVGSVRPVPIQPVNSYFSRAGFFSVISSLSTV